MAQLNVIEYDRGGWLTVSRQLHQPGVNSGARGLLDYYGKRIGELAALGLDVTKTQHLYRDGRPAYVSL